MNNQELLLKVDTLCARVDELLAAFQTDHKRPNPYAKLRETYPNAGKAWSATDDASLQQFFNDGKSVEELASSFGRTANGIRQRLERLGIQVNA